MFRIGSAQFQLAPSLLIVAALLSACTRELTECNGPALNTTALSSLKRAVFASGTPANLVVPNPIDATNNRFATATDSSILNAFDAVTLPDLAKNYLDTGFLRVRLHSVDDSLSMLARPKTDGSFNYPITDLHYSEVMAFYSVQSVMKYVEALGFRFVKTRPLYVLAHARDEVGQVPEDVNAYYEHNTLSPNQPRLMSLYGEGNFAPGADRDMYWHEMGHFMNESISREVGIDSAGESGAVFSEASALHECMADYIAESLGNKDFIGKWINRNFEGTQPGEPLRWATDRAGNVANFAKELTWSGSGAPERYAVAEVCTRVLWQIRSQLQQEDSETGTIIADRLILSSLALLQKDASLRSFHDALLAADETLHCGLHERSIKSAFSDKGFERDVDSLGTSLQLTAQPVGLTDSDNVATTKGFGFAFKIANPGGVMARNVRVVLEGSSNFLPVVYSQSFGDLGAGKTITISADNLVFSVQGVADFSSTPRARYRIKVLSDNGNTVTKDGEVKP